METSRGWGRTCDHTGSVRQTVGEEMCAGLLPCKSFDFLNSWHMFLFVCIMTYLCCPQDSISQKSLDIQSRSDDQHSISSADRFTTDNHRQSQYSSASGISEEGSRSRTPMSKGVTLHRFWPSRICAFSWTSTCVFHRDPGASPVRSVADQMCGAAGADPDDRQHCVFSCHQ